MLSTLVNVYIVSFNGLSLYVEAIIYSMKEGTVILFQSFSHLYECIGNHNLRI